MLEDHAWIVVALFAAWVVLMSLRVIATAIENERRWQKLISEARVLRNEQIKKLEQLHNKSQESFVARESGAPTTPPPVTPSPTLDGFDVDIVEEPEDGEPARAAA